MAEEDLGTAALRDTFKFRTDFSPKGRQREADRSLERADRLNKIAATYDAMSQRRTNLLTTQVKLREAEATARQNTQQGQAAAAASQNVSRHVTSLRRREDELRAMFNEGGAAAAKAYMAQTRRLANDPKFLVGYEIMGAQARDSRDQVITNQQKILDDLIAEQEKQDATNIKYDNFLSIIEQDEDGNFVDDLSKDLQELLVFPDNLPPDVSTRASALNLAEKRVKSEIKSISSIRSQVAKLLEDAGNPKGFKKKRAGDGPPYADEDVVEGLSPTYLVGLLTRYKKLYRPASDELSDLIPAVDKNKLFTDDDGNFKFNTKKIIKQLQNPEGEDFDVTKQSLDDFGAALIAKIFEQQLDLETSLSERASRLGEAVDIDPDLNPDEEKIDEGRGGAKPLFQ
jgi:regulator of replication initiation timing|tara:strand:+ start:1613 stop:2809 length:1197 start_codon:yes stop_codon:yes gene_type:complete